MKSIIKFILLGVVIFFGIAVIFILKEINSDQNLEESDKIQTFKRQAFFEAIADKLIRPLITNRIDYYLKESEALQFLHDQAFFDKTIKKTDINMGIGPRVWCGQKIEIKYVSNTSHTPFMMESLPLISTQIGATDNPLLDNGLIGMHKGGIRILENPPSKVINDSEEKLKSNTGLAVLLVDVKDYYPPSVEGLIAFSDGLSMHKAAACGDTISIEYKIKELTGKIIKEGKTTYKLGSHTMPLAFELGLIGAQPSLKRIVVTPAELLTNSLNKKFTLNYAFHPKEAVVIEAKLIN